MRAQLELFANEGRLRTTLGDQSRSQMGSIPSIKSTWTIAAMALVALFAIVPVGACATKSNQGVFEMEHQLRYLTEAELIELLSLFPLEGKLEVRVAAGGKLTVRGRREHVSCVREFMQIVERTDVPPDNYVPK